MRKVLSLLASLVVVVPLVGVLGAHPARASGGSPATQPLVLVRDLNWPDVNGLSTAVRRERRRDHRRDGAHG